METLPAYISIVFIITTFVTIGFLLQSAKNAGLDSLPSRILIFILPSWIFFQAVLSVGGFYQETSILPPRLFSFGLVPAIGLILVYFFFFRASFIDKLPLRYLTLLHVVRIPVEIVLYWLFQHGQIPQIMTFAGLNFDILSGILAPLVMIAAFRGAEINRWLLIAFNFIGLILLINIVSIAIMALPTPLQQLAFEQPNRAVLYFPYIWLPTIIVPIVLFAHLSSLWKLFSPKGP